MSGLIRVQTVWLSDDFLKDFFKKWILIFVLFCHLLILLKINFIQNKIKEYHQSQSNSLDPGQT